MLDLPLKQINLLSKLLLKKKITVEITRKTIISSLIVSILLLTSGIFGIKGVSAFFFGSFIHQFVMYTIQESKEKSLESFKEFMILIVPQLENSIKDKNSDEDDYDVDEIDDEIEEETPKKQEIKDSKERDMENDFPTNDISSLNKFTESTKENNKPFAIEEKENISNPFDINFDENQYNFNSEDPKNAFDEEDLKIRKHNNLLDKFSSQNTEDLRKLYDLDE